QRFHLGGGGVLHGPDILEDQLCGHRTGGHHTVDQALGGDQLQQGLAVDLRHHLTAVAGLLGSAECHEDVGLVQARDGHEGVRLADSLLAEELAVRPVSHDHQRAGQFLAHLHAPLLVLVDDLYGHAHLQQLRCQIVAHFAGAHDHDRRGPGPEYAQKPEELLQFPGCGGEIDLVSRPQGEIAGGNDRLPLPGHGADQHPDLEIPVQFRKPGAVQGRVLRHPVLHQLQPPLGEGLQLHGGGEPQHTGDLTGRCRLRIDGHGQPQLTAHKPQLAAVFRAADTGDGVLHTHFLRHKAREDINLVAGGSGDQQIGLLHIRLLLH
ncbi:NTF2 fold immunity protein domain-containing protein, partial [Dysosmobacter welbionis]